MAVKITPVNGCAFLCFPGMANLLVYELSTRFNYTVEQTSSSFTDNTFYSNRALFYGDVLFCPDLPEEDPSAVSEENIGRTEAGESEAVHLWTRGI